MLLDLKLIATELARAQACIRAGRVDLAAHAIAGIEAYLERITLHYSDEDFRVH